MGIVRDMISKYKVIYDKKVKKQVSKLDPFVYKRIKKWIDDNLVGCSNPYFTGKKLCGALSKYWRYRVGDYRIVAEIDDENIKILIIKIGHRRNIYY